MAYYIGIDLGTTYSGAAVWRDGQVGIVGLGNHAAVIPSVLYLRDGEGILTGDAAERRATTDPARVAREFKRRMGDPTPIVVGGTPFSADALMARLLRWIVDAVREREGGDPTGIAVSHPANWGEYKRDLLRQAIGRADLDDVVMLSEPEAAAIHYASLSRVEPGTVIAVYDLGGGTFDAAVLRKSGEGWQTLGQPQGIERLGGVDFDEAVFQHVVASTGDAVSRLDPDDPAARASVAQLRRECVAAKEALSSDTDVSIPVLLPNLQTEVRLTRAEFEHMVRPLIVDTITALHRAIRSAGLEPGQVDAVLLVGGSSRIPLVAQLVGADLSRPVAVDAHPKHAVALGAALLAANRQDAAAGPLGSAGAPPLLPPPLVPSAPEPATAASPPMPPAPPPPLERIPEAPPPSSRGRKRVSVLVGVGVLVAALAAGALALTAGSDDGDATASEPDTSATSVATTALAATTQAAPQTDDAAPSTSAIPDGPRVHLDRVVLEGDKYRVFYTVSGYTPKVDGGPDSLHIHFFLNTTAPANAGTNGHPPGVWHLTDQLDTLLTQFGPADKGEATEICTVVATVEHGVYDPDSGNCLPLPD